LIILREKGKVSVSTTGKARAEGKERWKEHERQKLRREGDMLETDRLSQFADEELVICKDGRGDRFQRRGELE